MAQPSCKNHPGSPAIGTCTGCQAAVCVMCLEDAPEGIFCSSSCIDQYRRDIAQASQSKSKEPYSLLDDPTIVLPADFPEAQTKAASSEISKIFAEDASSSGTSEISKVFADDPSTIGRIKPPSTFDAPRQEGPLPDDESETILPEADSQGGIKQPSEVSGPVIEAQDPAEQIPLVVLSNTRRAVAGAPAGTVCENHPDTMAAFSCASCSKPICGVCLIETPEGVFCSPSCRGRLGGAGLGSPAGRGFRTAKILASAGAVVLGIGAIMVFVQSRTQVPSESPPAVDRGREVARMEKPASAPSNPEPLPVVRREPKAEVKEEPKLEPKPVLPPEVKPEEKPPPKPEPKPEVKPEPPKPEAVTPEPPKEVAKPVPPPAPKAEPKPEPKPEVKPEPPKPEVAKPEPPKAEPKPAPPPEPKPGPKPEVKSDPKPEPPKAELAKAPPPKEEPKPAPPPPAPKPEVKPEPAPEPPKPPVRPPETGAPRRELALQSASRYIRDATPVYQQLADSPVPLPTDRRELTKLAAKAAWVDSLLEQARKIYSEMDPQADNGGILQRRMETIAELQETIRGFISDIRRRL